MQQLALIETLATDAPTQVKELIIGCGGQVGGKRSVNGRSSSRNKVDDGARPVTVCLP